MSAKPTDVQPDAVLEAVVNAVPKEVLPNIIVIGSIAAAYSFAGGKASFSVHTKDVDSVLSPRGAAIR